MSSFKTRRQLLATGGLNVPSGTSSSFNGSASFAGTTTFGGPMVYSGCTTMSSSVNKVTGLAQFGVAGTSLSCMLFGSAAITVGSAATGSFTNATVTIANMNTSDKVFVTAASLSASMVLAAAKVTGASVLTCTFTNVGSGTFPDAAITINYLSLR